jgi:simple sugar transport system permease protein
MNLTIEIIRSALASAIPVLLVALGGAYSYHANVFNIAMEGMMLASAFTSVAVSYASSSWVLGLIAGIGGSLLISLIFAFFTLKLKTGEFLTGIALNLFIAGATTYLLRQIFNVKGALISPKIVPLPRINIPVLDNIPFVGPIVNKQNILIYIAIFVIVPIVYLNINRQRFGLRLRATGFDHKVVDSVGIMSDPIKLQALLIGGVLCGLGGTALSLGYMRLFTEGISAGRGWIALAIIIVTKGQPLTIFLLALIFGLFEGAGLSLQNVGIPSQFTAMLPYLSTIVALFIFSIKKKSVLTAG